MGGRTSGQTYLSNLGNSVPDDHPLHDLFKCSSLAKQRVCYLVDGSSYKEPQDPQTLCSWIKGNRERFAVCLVENICPEWIASLGVEWGLDPTFFIEHAARCTGKPLWSNVMLPDVHVTDQHSIARRHWYIEGVLSNLSTNKPYERRMQRGMQLDELRYGLQATTRISYYRVHHRLYLFLLDPPFERDDGDASSLPPSKLSLWVPYSTTIYGGVPIPQLYDMPVFSPLELLQNFFDHTGHWHVLFLARYQRVNPDDPNEHVATNPQILSQFLGASLWRTNVDHIDGELKRIAFRDLRRPNMQTNDRLHQLREDLYILRDMVGHARKFLGDGGRFPSRFDAKSQSLLEWPTDMLENVAIRAEAAERFLMDTFQLLMSSISVRDSQSSIESARRGVFLTQLAAIYLPLSLVTGIWGMNLKEISESPPPAWVTAVTLLVVAAATAALLLVLRYWRYLPYAVSIARTLQRPPGLPEKSTRWLHKRKSAPDAAVPLGAMKRSASRLEDDLRLELGQSKNDGPLSAHALVE